MQGWKRRLAPIGTVVTFDYPYMRDGRKAPDRPAALIAAHREALLAAQQQHGAQRPVILAGKSMGSRIGCHLAVELARAAQPAAAGEPTRAITPAGAAGPVLGIVCFGYPLRGAGSGALRDEVLRELRSPILFVQGTRDPLCSLPELETVRAAMQADSELCVVQGGDHSLHLSRKRGLGSAQSNQDSQEASDRRVLEAVQSFVTALLPRGGQGP
jgi:predicted alpha/beta-hydrolase family hydrolase